MPLSSPAPVVSSSAQAATPVPAPAPNPVGETPAKLPPPSRAANQPAKVILADGKLTVEANNSDLTQILRDLAAVSGMTIKGLNGGPRVFGVYGPDNSREVLAALLVGSGYNFIMVGGSDGDTPRELLLTPQNSHGTVSHPANQNADPSANADEPDQAEEAPGPGALSPASSPDDQDEDVRVQQTLQRLKEIHNQQPAVP